MLAISLLSQGHQASGPLFNILCDNLFCTAVDLCAYRAYDVYEFKERVSAMHRECSFPALSVASDMLFSYM